MKPLTLRHYSPNYVLLPEKEQFCSYCEVVNCANLYIFHAPSTNGWVPSNFMVKSHQIKWTGGPCPNIVQSICRGRGHMCFIYSYCLIYCSQMFFHCFADWKQLKPQYLYGGVVVCSAYCSSVEILQSISGNHMINLTEIEEIL